MEIGFFGRHFEYVYPILYFFFFLLYFWFFLITLSVARIFTDKFIRESTFLI